MIERILAWTAALVGGYIVAGICLTQGPVAAGFVCVFLFLVLADTRTGPPSQHPEPADDANVVLSRKVVSPCQGDSSPTR